jgi:hypothetical protein
MRYCLSTGSTCGAKRAARRGLGPCPEGGAAGGSRARGATGAGELPGGAAAARRPPTCCERTSLMNSCSWLRYASWKVLELLS